YHPPPDKGHSSCSCGRRPARSSPSNATAGPAPPRRLVCAPVARAISLDAGQPKERPTMRRLSYVLACILSLTLSGTYIVLVDGPDCRHLSRITDADLAALIDQCEQGGTNCPETGLQRLYRERRLRRYLPGWADGLGR